MQHSPRAIRWGGWRRVAAEGARVRAESDRLAQPTRTLPRGAPRSPTTKPRPAPPSDRDVQLRGRSPGEPRRDRLLRALRGTHPLGRRRRGRAVRDRRALRARRCPPHGRDRRRVRGARGHVTPVLRGQAVRGRARARRHSELVRRVPPAAHRRVRRVRAEAGTGWAHRRQHRQPRAQALPQPGRRRRAHPPGRAPAPAARRGRLAQRRRRGRQLRVGVVPQRGESGAAGHDRTHRDREQGSLRPRAEPRRSRATRAAVGEHDRCRRVHGSHARRVEHRARERAPRRASRAVPGRPPRPADRPVHLRERSGARPVHGLGLHAGRGEAPRTALHRLRPRRDLRRHRPPARPRRRHARGAGSAPRPRRGGERHPSRPLPGARYQGRQGRAGVGRRALDPHRLQDRREELEVAWYRRHDQLHRHRRRRRRVVLRRIGRVHEHPRWAVAHRHGVEDARARARAPNEAQRSARVPHVGPPEEGQRGRPRVRAPRPNRADSSTRSRCDPPRVTNGCGNTRRAGTPRCRSPASSRSGRPEDRDHRGGDRPRNVRSRRPLRRAGGTTSRVAERGCRRSRPTTRRLVGGKSPRPVRRVVDERTGLLRAHATRCAEGHPSSSNGGARIVL